MESSGTISCAAIRKLSFSRTGATAGPDKSFRSPRAQESLTVTTAARKTSGVATSAVEEAIFLFSPPAAAGVGRSGGRGYCRAHCRAAARHIATGRAAARNRTFAAALATTVAGGFVEQAQALHQQPLRVELRGFLVGLTFEIEFETSAGPAQNFEDRFVAHERAIGCVLDLTFHEKYLALVTVFGQRQLAAFAAHLERLHKVDDVHLRQIAAHHAIGGRSLRHFFERDAVDHALDAFYRFPQEKWLLQIVVRGVLGRYALGNVS